MNVADYWVMGGAWMVALFMLGLVGLAYALVVMFCSFFRQLARPTLWAALGLLAYGLLIVGVGALGRASKLREAEAALATVGLPAEQATPILEAARREAEVPFVFGLLMAGLPLVFGSAAVAGARWRLARMPRLVPSPAGR